MFKFGDAYAAKFYFDRFRKENDIWFHWHYNITEAVVKNAYIAQQVNHFADGQDIFSILDLGCGNGHVSRFLAKTQQCKVVGFDIGVTSKIQKLNLKFNLKSKFKGYNCKTTLFKANHNEFFSKNKIKFDLIIDNCSVTHFDTSKSGKSNVGWNYVAKNMKNHLKFNGAFITATDVSSGLSSNEFCFEAGIIETFNENGWELINKDVIYKSQTYLGLNKIFSGFSDDEFLRVPPPGTLDGGALGVTGMVFKLRN